MFFLRVAQPEQLEEGLARLAGAALQQDALPALLTHGAVQVPVLFCVCYMFWCVYVKCHNNTCTSAGYIIGNHTTPRVHTPPTTIPF